MENAYAQFNGMDILDAQVNSMENLDAHVNSMENPNPKVNSLEILDAEINKVIIPYVTNSIRSAWQDAYTAEVHREVETRVKMIAENLQKKSQRALLKAQVRANIKALGDAMKERNEMRDTFLAEESEMKQWIHEKERQDARVHHAWILELRKLEDEDEAPRPKVETDYKVGM